MQVPFASVEEAIGLLQQAQGELQAKLTATSDAAWDDTKGKFLFDGQMIYELPNRDLGWMLFIRLDPPPRTAEYVPPANGQQGAVDLRPVSRRSRRALGVLGYNPPVSAN